MKIQYCWFAVFFVFFSASGQSRTLGIDENQVNLIPAYDFDLAGSWTAITYDVVWDNIAEKVVRFEPVDTIEAVVFNRLIGFPSRAYRLMAIDGQDIWKDAVFNLDSIDTVFKVYWHGEDDVKDVAKVTTYGEMGVQFNIDMPDSKDKFDDNLFIELVRNEIKPKQ